MQVKSTILVPRIGAYFSPNDQKRIPEWQSLDYSVIKRLFPNLNFFILELLGPSQCDYKNRERAHRHLSPRSTHSSLAYSKVKGYVSAREALALVCEGVRRGGQRDRSWRAFSLQ